MTIKIGDKAPEFALKDKDGQLWKLKDLPSDHIVIYFYPKDNTTGCTTEATEFTQFLPHFKRLKTKVIGISGGDEKSKQKFCEQHNLKVLLLSDPEFTTCNKYGVYGEKSFLGKKFMGIKRTTFVLDNKHAIIKIYENVRAEGHSKDVLRFLESLHT